MAEKFSFTLMHFSFWNISLGLGSEFVSRALGSSDGTDLRARKWAGLMKSGGVDSWKWGGREVRSSGGEAAAKEKRWTERRGGNPSGKQRVLSDRLGLCNRIGAFSVCACVLICAYTCVFVWCMRMCVWPPVRSQMCLQLLLLSHIGAMEVVRENITHFISSGGF